MTSSEEKRKFMEDFKRAILLEGRYVTQLGPEPVDSQISIEVSNPRLEKVKMKQQQSTRLLAMMKAMMTKDEDDDVSGDGSAPSSPPRVAMSSSRSPGFDDSIDDTSSADASPQVAVYNGSHHPAQHWSPHQRQASPHAVPSSASSQHKRLSPGTLEEHTRRVATSSTSSTPRHPGAPFLEGGGAVASSSPMSSSSAHHRTQQLLLPQDPRQAQLAEQYRQQQKQQQQLRERQQQLEKSPPPLPPPPHKLSSRGGAAGGGGGGGGGGAGAGAAGSYAKLSNATQKTLDQDRDRYLSEIMARRAADQKTPRTPLGLEVESRGTPRSPSARSASVSSSSQSHSPYAGDTPLSRQWV